MKSFKDTNGRSWAVVINVASVRKVRADCSVDLLAIVENRGKLLAELADDPVRLCEILACLCADQIGGELEAFYSALGGDVLEHALTAFMEELIDFFPKPGVRAALGSLMAKMRTTATIIEQRAQKEVDAIDPATVAESMLGSLSTGSPALQV